MSNEHHPTRVIGTLPRAWKHEESFADSLYEWMERAPWLVISGALHFVMFLIVAAIPWSALVEQDDQDFAADIAEVREPEIEEPEEELDIIEPEVLPDIVPIEDMVEISESESISDEMSDTAEGDPAFQSDSPLTALESNDLLGIGGGAGGKMGNRFGGGDGGRGGGRSAESVDKGLRWLAAHQDDDGGWDCDGFMKHDPAGDTTDGAGDPNHDIGVTGLALLAFLGDGHSITRGRYKDTVKRGVKWLLATQDRESGLIGEEIGHAFLYDHAVATLALCEVVYIDRSVIVKGRTQKAVNYISRARNPYGVWRYEVPANGEDDTSVTGWMVFALRSAEDAGLRIDRDAYTAAIQWFDEMTDTGTGRVGYTETGSQSSRVPGMNDQFPTELGESLTSVALLCRFFLGQDPADVPVMKAHAELLLRSLPEWDPEGFGCDMYYWYYGSYAMYQMGGKYWKQWRKALDTAVTGAQRKDGAAAGSWDPVGPWGYSGGRVYSTATMTLCLEAYYRYTRVLGGR